MREGLGWNTTISKNWGNEEEVVLAVCIPLWYLFVATSSERSMDWEIRTATKRERRRAKKKRGARLREDRRAVYTPVCGCSCEGNDETLFVPSYPSRRLSFSSVVYLLLSTLMDHFYCWFCPWETGTRLCKEATLTFFASTFGKGPFPMRKFDLATHHKSVPLVNALFLFVAVAYLRAPRRPVRSCVQSSTTAAAAADKTHRERQRTEEFPRPHPKTTHGSR